MKPYLVMLIGGMTAMQADAGALMTMKTQTADGEAVTSTITVDSDRVRMDDGKGGAAIYRGDRKEMLIVNPGDKSYVVFDKAAADELVAQVSPALQEMREQLAQLPPEQRATDAEFAQPPFHGCGSPARNDRHLDPGRHDLLDAVPVTDVEGLRFDAVVGVDKAAIREDTVHVQHQ